MWKETIHLEKFYDFDYTLLRWGFEPLTKLDTTERWVDLPVRLKEEEHVVRVKAIGTTANPVFEVTNESLESKQSILEHIQNLFQWNKDLEQVQDHFLNTNLASLFTKYPGTPIVKDFHFYDCLIKVIIHQQLNMKFAQTLSTRFVQKFGSQKKGVWFYPQPEDVAVLAYDDLRALQFSQRKAEYVIDTSRKIVNGELDLTLLATKKNEEVMKELVKIRGVGPWTAENWLMFGVGRENLLPKADIGIQNAMKHHFGLSEKPTKEQMIELSKDWQPYQSYASLTLWRSIEG